MVDFIPGLRPRALECPMCETAVIAEPKGFVATGADWEPGQQISRWTLYACEKEHPILTLEDELGFEATDEGIIVSIDFYDHPYRVYPPQDRILSNEIPSQLRRYMKRLERVFEPKRIQLLR